MVRADETRAGGSHAATGRDCHSRRCRSRGCGDDDDEAAGDTERYCQLTRELDKAGEDAFAPLEADETATEEDFADAGRRFFDEHRDDFNELRQTAPEEIREDVTVLLDGMKARAGGEEPPPEADAAEGRIQEFEAQNCS